MTRSCKQSALSTCLLIQARLPNSSIPLKTPTISWANHIPHADPSHTSSDDLGEEERQYE